MSTDLTIYGNKPDVKELGERVKRFLPGGADMTAEDALSFAQISIAQNLNPFAREIWYIPGIGTVTGIQGYRKMAKRQAHYSAETRMMTPEERDAHQLNDGDVGAVCELYRPDVIMEAVKVNEAAGKIVIPIAPILGTGIRRANEKRLPKGRSALWVAEKRAEADALRKGFDLGVAYNDNNATAIAVKEAPEWAVAETEVTEVEDPEAVLARGRALLRGDDDIGEADKHGLPAQTDDPAEEPEPEADDDERLPKQAGPAFPVAWRAYADKVVEELPFKDIYHVIDVLKKAGVSPVSNAAGDCAFKQADVWIILSEHEQGDDLYPDHGE